MDSLSFPSHLRKHPYLALILLALLITIIVAGAPGKGFHTPFSDDKEEILGDPYAILRSSCNDTLYPKLCFKTRASKSQALSGTTRSEILHHMSPKNHFNLSESHFSADKYQLLQPTPANLKILLSAAMTNQDTCLSEFSRPRFTEDIWKKAGQELVPLTHISVTLSLLRPPRGPQEKFSISHSEKVKVNMVMAKDGSGNYTMITDLMRAAANWTMQKTMIELSMNVVDDFSTFNSSTMEHESVFGDGFMARDLTVVDTAGPTKHQAVALHGQYLGLPGHPLCPLPPPFYRDCHIYGTVDFIFSNASTVFQNCQIFPHKRMSKQQNMITSHSRFQPTHDTSFIFQNCTIQGAPDLEPVKCNFSTYLGRPWRPHARMVIMQLYLGDAMGKEGWHPWGTSQCNIQRRVWSTRNGDPGLTQREG
ncbi:hypothetical protein AMTRI_Chr05g71020 [Amborella trichopoda]